MTDVARHSLEKVVAFLSDPASYRHRPVRVDALATHWSWIFMADGLVYKLKKPLFRPGVDLTMLETRHQNCLEELRLNRRLTDDVYLRVLAVRQLSDGRLSLGEEGEAVEWLIEMRRLPGEQMLDARLKSGRVNNNDIAAIITRLSGFYGEQRCHPRLGQAYVRHLLTEAVANKEILLRQDLGLDTPWTRDLLEQVEVLLRSSIPAIEERIAGGHLVEGHGDLRPEHVCLVDPPQIFDCLEFDRGMRILDPFDEVNYLGLECEFLGARWVRTQLLAMLEDLVGERPAPRLMATYGAFRATLRARICLAHLLDPQPMDPQRWPDEARAYLSMAEAELHQI